MGHWGTNTFDNDIALDWLGEFLDNPSEALLLDTFSMEPTRTEPGILLRLLGKKSIMKPKYFVWEEILAAAEVTATLQGLPADSALDELSDLPQIDISEKTVTFAIAALNQVLKLSSLKERESWKDPHDYEKWLSAIQNIRSRLIRA